MTALSAVAADPTIGPITNVGSLTTPAPVLNVYFAPFAPMARADLENRDNWRVTAFYATTDKPPSYTAKPLEVGNPDASTYIHTARVNVPLKGPAEPAYDHVTVQYSGPVGASTKTVKPPPPKTGRRPSIFEAAKGKDSADINLNGTISPAVGSGPTYATDSSIAFKVAGKNPKTAWWGLAASAKTDNRKVADPSSFRWRASWQYIEDGKYLPNWDVGLIGMEFDVKGQAINLLASPRFTAPVWLHDWPKAGPLAGVAELDLYGGIEAGTNLKDTFRFAGNKMLSGTHGLFRGVPGATLTVKKLKQVTFTSDYQVRLLATREIFLETRLHTKDPIPELRQQPRHYWVNNITYNVTSALGLTVKHEFGSLPPAFTYLQHKVSIGFTLLLKENKTLRIY
jgi:hypothetical protein